MSLDDDVVTRPGSSKPTRCSGRAVDSTRLRLGLAEPDQPVRRSARVLRSRYPYEARVETTTRITDTTARVVCHMGCGIACSTRTRWNKHLFGALSRGVPEPAPVQVDSTARLRGAPDVLPLFIDELRVCAASCCRPCTRCPCGPASPTVMHSGVRRHLDRLHCPVARDEARGCVHHRRADRRPSESGDLHREMLGAHYGMLISPYLYCAVDRAMSRTGGELLDDVYGSDRRMLRLDRRVWRELRVPDLYRRYILELMRGWSDGQRCAPLRPPPDAPCADAGAAPAGRALLAGGFAPSRLSDLYGRGGSRHRGRRSRARCMCQRHGPRPDARSPGGVSFGTITRRTGRG